MGPKSMQGWNLPNFSINPPLWVCLPEIKPVKSFFLNLRDPSLATFLTFHWVFCSFSFSAGVEKLIRLPLTEAKIDANNRFQRIESSQPHRDESSIHTSRSSSPYIDQPQQGVSQSQISEHEIKETYRTGTARAWAPQITKPDPGMNIYLVCSSNRSNSLIIKFLIIQGYWSGNAKSSIWCEALLNWYWWNWLQDTDSHCHERWYHKYDNFRK